MSPEQPPTQEALNGSAFGLLLGSRRIKPLAYLNFIAYEGDGPLFFWILGFIAYSIIKLLKRLLRSGAK